ncbi:hypothetical protein NQ318_019802 [Aromia moschata]|uniref:C2H2-type domain-containing protein n=1 Tax=Aromia moschata TaxID=1265417 RepID=A0AAV8YLL6_9CUCU|nr:hypothetical protein NQ318_019802 [Aromia moschata]
MSENSSIPYLLQLKDAVNAIHLSETEVSNVEIPREISLVQSANITVIPSYDGLEPIYIQPVPEVVQKSVDVMEIETQTLVNSEVNFIYEIISPEQLNLKPIYNLKRGRPKKKKVVEVPSDLPKPVKPAPRTRSGRLVKFPKYIEKDFKKVEIEEGPIESEESDLKTSEFSRCADDDANSKKADLQLEFHQRKRKISAQYRCPKCKKAYLGKFRMVQHIKKYPDHGPLPNNELNFDVWNYLVDITQKCPPAQRGVKFCEELTNLLHNVLLLTSALFKKAEINKNHVDVDKVLGNAIGLPPGPYKFNDNELYKDVTVLKLITNSDFFKPSNRSDDDKVCNKNSSEESKLEVSNEKREEKAWEGVNGKKQDGKEEDKGELRGYFNNKEGTKANIFPSDKKEVKTDVSTQFSTIKGQHNPNAPSPDNFIKGNDTLGDRLSVHTDLLSENSLLHLPNLRNSVDELIMSGTTLLDNSTSSDEVMNVDQFVNERFKKITEPEMELSNGGLNLDLPSLDLFQFHNS